MTKDMPKDMPKAIWYDCGDGLKLKVVDEEIFPDWDVPILDWEGLEEDGKVLPYSKENVRYILKKYKEVAMYVSTLMEDPAMERLLYSVYSSRLR